MSRIKVVKATDCSDPMRVIARDECFGVGWLNGVFCGRIGYVDLECVSLSIHAITRSWTIHEFHPVEFSLRNRCLVVERVGDYLIMNRVLIDDGFGGVALAVFDLASAEIFYGLSGLANCAHCTTFENIQRELLGWLDMELAAFSALSALFDRGALRNA